MQILGKVRKHHTVTMQKKKKRFENLGEKNTFSTLKNVLMGNKFVLGEEAAEGSCHSSW